MRFSTAVVTKRRQSEVALGAACLILVSVTASGCVLGNDNERPVLAVDPLWDLSPGPRFVGGTCDEAGVDTMSWEIQDSRGRTLEKSEKPERCLALDFLNLKPGTYTLVITGYDRDEKERWTATCEDLTLGRFDMLYPCEVDQIDEQDESGGDDEDAGTD